MIVLAMGLVLLNVLILCIYLNFFHIWNTSLCDNPDLEVGSLQLAGEAIGRWFYIYLYLLVYIGSDCEYGAGAIVKKA